MLKEMYSLIVARMKSEEGATAVEYGIIVSLIAVAIVATVLALGGALDGVFASVVEAL